MCKHGVKKQSLTLIIKSYSVLKFFLMIMLTFKQENTFCCILTDFHADKFVYTIMSFYASPLYKTIKKNKKCISFCSLQNKIKKNISTKTSKTHHEMCSHCLNLKQHSAVCTLIYYNRKNSSPFFSFFRHTFWFKINSKTYGTISETSSLIS
jgi:hypothetical protein